MSTFGHRIKKARLEAGLSQEALAEAMSQLIDKKKISRTAITQWESSKTKGIEAANLLKATKVLNVTPDWLQFGKGSMRPMQAPDFTSHACFVPLLSYSQAINPLEKDKEIISNIGLDEQLAKVAGPHSFALIIKDNSMSPLFMRNDIIVIDPNVPPCPGEFVAARLQGYEAVVFRKFRPLSHENSSQQFELAALNEDWGKIIVDDKTNGEVIGTLIEHRCRRRIYISEEMAKEQEM